MNKKTLKIIIAVVVVTLIIAATAFAISQGACAELKIENATLIGYDGIAIGKIEIPYGVKTIGYGAFGGALFLSKVEIPYSVTSIEGYAFSGNRLKSVEIPNSVTSIGEGAFWGCEKLTSIIIPNSVTEIDKSAFELADGTVDHITIYGEENSFAQEYAEENGIKFAVYNKEF